MHVDQKQSEGEALDETFTVWCPLGEDILKGVLLLFLFLPSPSLLDRGGDLHDVKERRGDPAGTGGDILSCLIRYWVLVLEYSKFDFN